MDNSNPFWIGARKLGDKGYQDGDDMFIPNTAIEIENNYQINDILVYFNEFGRILHSAVIVEIDGDTVIVQSKWGKAGVYRHTADTVPSAYVDGNGQVQYLVYRYHHYVRTITDLGHSLSHHSYLHTDLCSVCGQILATNIVRVECSGPPCAIPFALQNSGYNEVPL